ncbi:MAG: LPS-assembly protein LptD [Hyphomicrobiales bacterium]|nr:LPS-assembly protein LptD [Hyphomicrobiales bacterium]MDE2113321.1 LPS-assembly protein LptD [Hyphomicrobiales bacterium]
MAPVVAGLAAAMALPALAQTSPLAAQQTTDGKTPDRMLLNADTLTYNKDTNVATAEGHVRMYYQGRALQADEVRYDRAKNRVYAMGHAKLTDADGTVSYANKFDLTDDFKDGFVDELRSETVDHAHFTAARAERSDGNVTSFNKGLYSACQRCADHPERPPIWQVKARKIIENGETHTVYFEDAYLEFFGMPVAYIPYFSSPDASVTRKTGFLNPSLLPYSSTLGPSLTVPYFWNLAPNYDLTFSPTFSAKQGFLGDVEWRQRLANGSYSIRASGISQQDQRVFLAAPYGPGDRRFRGSLESKGLFYLSPQWKFGWNAEMSTDKFFSTNYKNPLNGNFDNNFHENISTAYLTGQSARGYFNLSGYYFHDLSAYDLQKQQAVVLPSIDYNKTIDINPATSGGIGGQVEIDGNFTSLNRSIADYQATGANYLDNAFGLYNVCNSYTPGTTTGHCLLRGIGGDYSRATLNLSWKRKLIDPIGEVWTPFAFAHLNGEWINPDNSNSVTIGSANGTSVIANTNQSAFLGSSNTKYQGQATPGIGMEYRYPLFASTPWATQVLEPIAQIVARPNRMGPAPLINEDAQSLVFDDSNLFDWSKYSGYDRFETGVRANVGAQYSMNFTRGGYANFMAGQSYQLAGINSFATPDAANVGLGSGLDQNISDIVTRVTYAPDSTYDFVAKGRFDHTNFTMHRLDLAANGKWGNLTAGVQYARYMAQPAIGFNQRREGLALDGKYIFAKDYYVKGNIAFDLSRYLDNGLQNINVNRFSVAAATVGVGFDNDCTTFGVQLNTQYTDPTTSSRARNTTVLMELKLKTLGSSSVQTSLGTQQVSSTAH